MLRAMAPEALNVRQLSATEKIALMERLWESLSDSDALSEPPEWHETILRERETEWKARDDVAQEWEVAKEEIRKQVR
jgi:hypothetical protein